MSASHEWTEWHLTPSGWVSGSERVDFGGVTEKPAPPDRVLTCRYTERLSSSFSTMDRTVRELWRRPGDDALIASLLKKHGECPKLI